MNTLQFIYFLRHLIFLLALLKLIGSVIIVHLSDECHKYFRKTNILPPNLSISSSVVEITVEFMILVMSSFQFLIILICITSLIGSVFLNKWPMINFAGGLGILFASLGEFFSVYAAAIADQSFREIITSSLETTFDATNFRKDNATTSNLVDGWSERSGGSIIQRMSVDYLHFGLKCCGLTGRSYWEIRIPESCCTENYQNEECTVEVARDEACYLIIKKFAVCYVYTITTGVILGTFSVATAGVSLYLAHLKMKCEDGDYDMDMSSDSDDFN